MRNKIILVDDDFTLCELGKEMFEILDIECFTAMSMDEAIAIWNEHHTDIGLGIFDLNLEGCTGIDVYQALCEVDKDFHAVIASGAFLESDADEYRAMGFKEIISKPYNLATLQNLIKKYL